MMHCTDEQDLFSQMFKGVKVNKALYCSINTTLVLREHVNNN